MDGGDQCHVHVLWSARTLDGIDRSPATFFKRYNPEHPERGGAEKSEAFYHMGAVKASRVLYCDTMNVRLEQNFETVRLHPDRLIARGFDRAPEPRALPSDSNKAKFAQEVTPIWAKVLEHRAGRGQDEAAELVDAQRYWEARKQVLGMSWEMPLEQQMSRIIAAREQAIAPPPSRQHAAELGRQAEGLEARIQELETYHRKVSAEVVMEHAYEHTGKARKASGVARVEVLLDQAKDHGIELPAPAQTMSDRVAERVAERVQEIRERPRSREGPGKGRSLLRGLDIADEPTGSGVQVRIREREHERDDGLDLGC